MVLLLVFVALIPIKKWQRNHKLKLEVFIFTCISLYFCESLFGILSLKNSEY